MEIEVTPAAFGRLAAQTAKQVVMQKIREAERGVIFEQYTEKESEVLTAVVHRIDKSKVFFGDWQSRRADVAFRGDTYRAPQY